MGDTAAWPHDQTLHAWWVEPGRLLAGEYPGARTPEEAAEKVRLLVEEAGIDSIVDLTTPADGLAPYRDALRAAHAYGTKPARAESFISTVGAGRDGPRRSWVAFSSTTDSTTSRLSPALRSYAQARMKQYTHVRRHRLNTKCFVSALLASSLISPNE